MAAVQKRSVGTEINEPLELGMWKFGMELDCKHTYLQIICGILFAS